MKEKITICKLKNNTPHIIGEKSLPVELNETEMELYAKYQGETYKVQGNIYCQYIIVGELA